MTRLALTLAAPCLAALLLPSAAAARIRVDRGIAGVRSKRRAVRRRVDGITCQRFPEGTSCHTGEFEAGGRVTDFWLDSGRVVRVTVGFVID